MSLSNGEPPFEPPVVGGDNVVWITSEESKRREARKRGPNLESMREWLALQLPQRDYLLGKVLATTSRWLIYGDTGIGKTLFTLMLAGAVAAGDQFLNWPGTGIKRRVLYLDGEMPAETMQERLKLVAAIYGEEIELYVANRDRGDWPPLNDRPGIAWLKSLLDIYVPDLIVFDSIMSLVGGIMMEEESWKPMRQVVRWLSSPKATPSGPVGQIWVHHTGHDSGHSYGTKTREWEMCTTVGLHRSKNEDGEVDESDEETRVELVFQKARLRTPQTAAQFRARSIVFDGEREAWIEEAEKTVTRPAAKGRPRSGESGTDQIKRLIETAYDALCLDGAAERVLHGDGRVELKMEVGKIKAWLMRFGHLDGGERGRLEGSEKMWFNRARRVLVDPKAGRFAQDGEVIWRLPAAERAGPIAEPRAGMSLKDMAKAAALLQIISPDDGSCEHCGSAEGTTYRIRHKFRGHMQAHVLHEACGVEFFNGKD